MKLKVKITGISIVNELNFYWQKSDYLALLEAFNYADPNEINPDEILDYLLMSITDFEPPEAAEIILTYKLSEKLNEGQIQNLSHEMLVDKVAEEYSDPALHYDLFNINQLLYKAYNGTFPNTAASIIKLSYLNTDFEKHPLTKELLIKTLGAGLKDNNLILRLYKDQVLAIEPFKDAAKVIWHYREITKNEVEIITSKYWIDKDDFNSLEFVSEIIPYEEED